MEPKSEIYGMGVWEIKRTLKTFQELTIRGRESNLRDFFETLTMELEQAGWERNTNGEEQYKRDSIESDGVFVKPPPLEDELQVDIILTSRKPHNEYRVTNIIPHSKGSLDYDEYNMVLNIFYDLFIKDKQKKYKLDVDLSEPEVSLDKYMSGKSVRLLETFSSAANKNTGSAHPSDRERWNRFIISVCKKDEAPAMGIVDIVRRWLIEVGGWSESVAGELVIEFEFGFALLKQYNEEVARELVNVE